jgi:Transposase DNA-binding/Transposase Tn5 dimerisation domain
MNTSWANHELCSASLPDQRLQRRLVHIVEALARRPESSVPQAAGNWAATKATYRFWANPRISHHTIRAAHRQSTLERLPPQGVLLAIQDTTSLDFTAHPATTGLGYLARRTRLGLWLHSTLCVSGAGVPLGVLHQRFWVRRLEELGKRAQRRHKETKTKESQRWLTAQTATDHLLPADRTVITLGDREADFYDLFALPRRPGRHLLVRAKSRRAVRHEARLLWAAVRSCPAQGQIDLELGRRPDRPARQATLTVRYGTFPIQPPSTHPRRKELPPLPVTAVLVEEENPPPGQTAVRWLLMTTLPVNSLAEAVQVVRWYTQRWLIERYHYTLKSGCRVEDLQLETAARLKRAVATYAIVAWRLLWLTYEARQHPEAPCDHVLSAREWQVLSRHFTKFSQEPRQPPSLQQAVRWIAQLGGFLARRHDGEPGVKVIWRGLRRLQDLVTGFQLTPRRRIRGAFLQQSPPVVGNG